MFFTHLNVHCLQMSVYNINKQEAPHFKLIDERKKRVDNKQVEIGTLSTRYTELILLHIKQELLHDMSQEIMHLIISHTSEFN